ncbi:MAG TPA: ATPase, T2SS/T4P/T4SS family, partial [Vicinamibacterales bacterium]|nr:ATPase, T2SS/T4P/T4SS family [Vicinamibacterales bacterium]
ASGVPPELERLLRLAAARGASALYLGAGARPMVRVDGEMLALENEPPIAAADVERLVAALAPTAGEDTDEWVADVPEVGRVRGLVFSDHRGPGAIFRMLPARAISAEQLGLSREIVALAAQPDGLVLVAGPRASGKSTLVSAFVDLVNRTRGDHVITIERRIRFVHESRRSYVSQREVRSDAEEAAAVRAALREDPDVLAIEDLRSSDAVDAVLEAAASGRLVFAGVLASSAAGAIERLIEQLPAAERARGQSLLAATLRGVIAQVLLRKLGGGRVAAREILLSTPAIATLIADGKLSQIPAALEQGRRQGMMPLNEALAALVRDGVVDAGEAWRKAFDREGLVARLKREGADTSFAERLA